ncbi:hypothetical protein [Alienimonas sp. DA493]|uniref:hypothetical protein n=1 Tax=Alienimonas sp. DA493 TaxID=3373605 RepID=UPI00375434F9
MNSLADWQDLADAPREPVKVELPDKRTAYHVAPTGDDRDAYEVRQALLLDRPRRPDDEPRRVEGALRGFVVAYCVCDARGNRIVEPGKLDEAAKTFGKLPARILNPIYGSILSHMLLTERPPFLTGAESGNGNGGSDGDSGSPESSDAPTPADSSEA